MRDEHLVADDEQRARRRRPERGYIQHYAATLYDEPDRRRSSDDRVGTFSSLHDVPSLAAFALRNRRSRRSRYRIEHHQGGLQRRTGAAGMQEDSWDGRRRRGVGPREERTDRGRMARPGTQATEDHQKHLVRVSLPESGHRSHIAYQNCLPTCDPPYACSRITGTCSSTRGHARLLSSRTRSCRRGSRK